MSVQSASAAGEWPPSLPTSVPTRAASSPSILVVEDGTDMRRMLRQYLEAYGATVLEASNGEGAWQFFLHARPDAVVAHADLPGMDGKTLARRVSRSTQRPPPPFILLCSSNEPGEVADLLEDGTVSAAFHAPLVLRDLCNTALRLGDAYKTLHGARTPATAASEVRRTPTLVRMGAVTTARLSTETVSNTRRASTLAMPATTGTNSLATLARVASRCFQDRVTAVLVVTSGSTVRKVWLHQGMVVATASSLGEERLGSLLLAAGIITREQLAETLRTVDREGCRLGHALTLVAPVLPSMVAQAVEEQTLWVTMQALCQETGTWELQPMTDNPILNTQLQLDPMEAVQRACLECVPDSAARVVLAGMEGRVMHNPSAEERFLTFHSLKPNSPVPTQVLDNPTVKDAMDRVALHPGGLSHLLALILGQAVYVSDGPNAPPRLTRPPQLAEMGGRWREPGLKPEVLAAREAVAREWLRSGGAAPHRVLQISELASAQEIMTATKAWLETFGERMAGLPMGPARRSLAVLRARFREAERIMLADRPPLSMDALEVTQLA